MPADWPALTTLIDRAVAPAWPLTPLLAERYGGPLGFPDRPQAAGWPYVIANFVTTLDGVVSYAIPGKAGGGPISGNDVPDRFVMGLLRACADAVIVGAGTLRSARREHAWTPHYIFPQASAEYASLRRALGKPPQPLTVVVTARGDLDLGAGAFNAPEVPVLIVTTPPGAVRLARDARQRMDAAGGNGERDWLPPNVSLHVVESAPGGAEAGAALSAAEILAAVAALAPPGLVLTEGGPLLLGAFLAGRALDELFLTLAPQIAGRAPDVFRPALAEGAAFSPPDAPWARLLSAKTAGDLLYLRYEFYNGFLTD